jgi:hypothetical protein
VTAPGWQYVELALGAASLRASGIGLAPRRQTAKAALQASSQPRPRAHEPAASIQTHLQTLPVGQQDAGSVVLAAAGLLRPPHWSHTLNCAQFPAAPVAASVLVMCPIRHVLANSCSIRNLIANVNDATARLSGQPQAPHIIQQVRRVLGVLSTG